MDVGADLELRVESEQALSKTHRRGQVEKAHRPAAPQRRRT